MEAEEKRKAGFSSDRKDYKPGGDKPPFREGFKKGPARSFGQKPFGGGSSRRDETSGDGERKPFRKDARSFGGNSRRDDSAGEGERKPFRNDARSFGGSSRRDDSAGEGERKPFRNDARSFGGSSRRDDSAGEGERKPFRKDARSFGDRERTSSGPSGARSREARPGDADKKPFSKGPRSFGDRDKSAGRPEKRDSKKISPAKNRLGTQAPEQAKEFRRKGAGAPEYDEKKLSGMGAVKGRRPVRRKTEEDKSEGQLIRLNRFIAQSGLCSRREADDLISTGQITVNGKVMDQMGYLVQPGDVVKYGRRLLNKEKLVYVLLNKPKDFLTTTEDPEERKTVMTLVENACKERIYPVGRLDRNTTGLLLLTNDGELSERLMHPSHNIRKIYQVDLDKPLTAADEAAIREGVVLEDGKAPVDELEVLSKERDIVGLSIHIGRNRIVRRIFESLGYKVIRLDRVMYAGLTKKDLPRGTWRYLSEKEVINLKYFS